ncbi:MAG: hypothetical protein IT538_04335 [Variibacter sp.]|nr:hypothetical protein [Variibacter sp.]
MSNITFDQTVALSPGRASTEFSGAQIAVMFLVCWLLATIPVWTHPIPPLSDYVNHLARMHVIASIGKDPALAGFYKIDWAIVPNLVMDMIVPVLGRFMNIYLAGQLFTALTFGLIASGALALNRALFGRWSVLPLAVLPLLYNYVFLVGLMNYLFGVGIALWALATWIALRERTWLIRLPVSAAFVPMLFFCHLSSLGVYAVGLLAYESLRLWQQREQPWLRRLVDFVATGLPFLPVGPLLLASPTMRLASDTHWEPQGKIDGLTYVIQVYSDIVAFALTAIVAVAVAWAIRMRVLRIHPLCWMLIAVGGLIYLAMPRMMFATYMADLRLPVAFAFMVVACASLDIRQQDVRRAFVVVLLVLLAVRVIEVDSTWSQLSSTASEFRTSVKRVKPGSKVLVAYADRTEGDDVRDLGLVHAACLAMIERSALVTTAFTVAGKQILSVRPPYRELVDSEDGTPPSVAQLLAASSKSAEMPAAYWDDWTENFDYLYVLFTDDEAVNPDPDHLKLVQEGGRFQLYRIIKPQVEARGAQKPVVR